MNKRERLLELIKEKALFRETITLSSGKKSDYYIDCRLITMDPEGATLISEIFFDMLKDKRVDSLGGPTIGADPIAGSFAVVSHQHGKPIPTFIIRKGQKTHGKQKTVEGPLRKGSRVAIVDDVATTGKSLLNAIQAVEEYGCEVEAVLVVVDRLEGAKEILAERGYELLSIFTKKDLLENES